MKTLRTSMQVYPSQGEICTTASETTPDQTMSMREILKRYGTKPLEDISDTQRDSGYSQDMEDFRGYDLVEMDDLGNRTRETIKGYQDAKQKAEAKKSTPPPSPPPTDVNEAFDSENSET